jgi:hypothetical protein
MALSFSILVDKSIFCRFSYWGSSVFLLVTCLGFEVYRTIAMESCQRCYLYSKIEVAFKLEIEDELDTQNFQKFEEVYHCLSPS